MLSKIEHLPEWLASSADRNTGTLWQVVKAYRANQRQGTVGVKTRGEIRSTGKKPYKQKKTGSARRGSFVSPLHVGGAVVHGPVARDYRQAIPQKMGNLALSIALAKRIQAGTIFSGQVSVSTGKTKDAAALLKNLDMTVGKTVVCLSTADAATLRAFRNLRGVVLVSPEQVNAHDIVAARNIVLGDDALSIIEKRLVG